MPSKPDALAKKAKGRFHLLWLAGPHILPSHMKLSGLALPPPGPVFGVAASDFSRRAFYKNRTSNFRFKTEKKNSQN